MSIDATFWVAIAFFIFFGGLIYLKVPQKINTSLTIELFENLKVFIEVEDEILEKYVEFSLDYDMIVNELLRFFKDL